MIEQVGEEAAKVLAVFGQLGEFAQRRFRFALQHRDSKRHDLASGGESEHRENIALDDSIAAEADELVEGGFCVTHSTIRAASDRVQGLRFDLNILFLRNHPE